MALIHDTKTINGSRWGSQKKKKNPNPDFAHRLLHRQVHSELHRQSRCSAPRSGHGLSTSRFRRSLSPGTNRSQHLSNPDQADLSLFLSQTHRTRSQPLWLWFGLGVDELGALLGFYSLDGLVWEWFCWCGSGWFDSVVVLCWLLGFYSFAWVWSSCSLIRWWCFGIFFFQRVFLCLFAKKIYGFEG